MAMTDDWLPVRLYGTRIGDLARRADGRAALVWHSDAAARWKLRGTPLSQSLPVGVDDPAATESFFGALLPEGQWLDRLSRELHVAGNDVIGLLSQVGADLAGALTIGTRIAAEPRTLGPEELAAVIRNAFGFTLGGGGSALPGFQRKATLTRIDGRWVAGNGSIASTHIIKPVDDDYRSAIEGENYVLGIARAVGLLHHESWVDTVGGMTALVVERYDRRVMATAVERIHQEDFAQALALPWGGDDKFQRNNPAANLSAIAALLDRDRTIFDRRERETERLLRAVTLNVAVGNTDAHAKNFSLLRFEAGGTALAPYYDGSPLALRYGARQSMAMTVAGVWDINDVTVEHLVQEGLGWGLPAAAARVVVTDTLDRIVEASHTLPAHESIIAHVPGYIRGRAQNLAEGRPARLDLPVPPMLMAGLGTPETIAQESSA